MPLIFRCVGLRCTGMYKCRGRQEKVRPGTGREAGLGHAGSDLCASKSSAFVLTLPLASLRTPKSDRLLVQMDSQLIPYLIDPGFNLRFHGNGAPPFTMRLAFPFIGGIHTDFAAQT